MKSNFLNRVISIFFLAPIFIFCVLKGMFAFNILLFLLFIIFMFEISKLKKVYTKILLSFLLLTFLYSFYNLRYITDGTKIIFLITFITWLSDIGGYLFGKLIGGKKINFISPNKTISGYCGSLILVQLNLIYIYYFKINLFNALYANILFLFFCTLIVIFASMIVNNLNLIKQVYMDIVFVYNIFKKKQEYMRFFFYFF